MLDRLALLIGLLSSELSLAATHCTSSEKIIFNCQLVDSRKVASVCASPHLTNSEGYLQYRFGIPGKLEFVYPATKAETQEQFFWRELRPYQSSVRELTFKNGDYYYTLAIYDVSEELNDIPGGYKGGSIEVEKSRGSSNPRVFKCASYPKSEIYSLAGIVQDGDALIGQ